MNDEVNSRSRLRRVAIQKGEPVPTFENKPKSFAPEVIADSSGKWAGNALRFATREEAERNVSDLASRWFLVRETRVVESDDPVNYKWEDGKLVAISFVEAE